GGVEGKEQGGQRTSVRNRRSDAELGARSTAPGAQPTQRRRTRRQIHRPYYWRDLTAVANRLSLRAAWLRWITPLLTVLCSTLVAAFRASCAEEASPVAMALRTDFTALRIRVRAARLRMRRFSLC